MGKIIISLLFITQVSAQCMVKYDRTACSGVDRSGLTNEAISYKKCGGEKTCIKEKKASTLEECQKAALKACSNRRYTITKSKVVTATWNGSQIKDTHGNADFCLKYDKREDQFNRCLK